MGLVPCVKITRVSLVNHRTHPRSAEIPNFKARVKPHRLSRFDVALRRLGRGEYLTRYPLLRGAL